VNGYHLKNVQISALTPYYCTLATECGYLAVLKYLFEQGFQLDRMRACIKAAEYGHLDVLKWLDTGEREIRTDRLTVAAACGGHLEVLLWLHENNYPFNFEVSKSATRCGHLEILKWLWNKGLLYGDIIIFSVRRGKMNVQIPVSENCSLHTTISTPTTIHGQLDIFKLLWEERKLYDEIAKEAVTGGNLRVLKWFWDKGCTFNVDNRNMAAKNGRMDVLMWLHENGCNWDSSTYLAAISSGDQMDAHHEILLYIHENGCPITRPFSEVPY
jgi:hypothetical protein